MDFHWKFHFGRKTYEILDWAKLGVVLNASIGALSFLPWLDRKKAFNLIDSLQLRGDYDFLNEYIINDREFLSYRLEREINKAIVEYEDGV